MRSYTVVVERCPSTGLYVGYVPGFPGAHSQAATLEELNDNLKEVIALILDDGTPEKEIQLLRSGVASMRDKLDRLLEHFLPPRRAVAPTVGHAVPHHSITIEVHPPSSPSGGFR